MSNFESDPAGLGVSKRYGPLDTGGNMGVTTAESGEGRIVFEVGAQELGASAAYAFTIPEGYARITDVFVETEEAFESASGVDVLVDTVTILTAGIVVTDVGLVTGVLAVDNLAFASTSELTLDVSGVTAGKEGFCKVVVEFQRA